MVERPRRGKQKHKLLANHQRSWLWGRHLVTEILVASRWPILELFLADDLPGEILLSLQQQAAATPFPYQKVPRERLTELAHTSEHQGFLARVGPYPYAFPAELFNTPQVSPVWLVLVGIQDPHNLGAILRSAEVFGVTGVFIGERDQAGVNSQVARSSAGAVTRLRIARVSEFESLLDQLHARGARTFATTLQSSRPLTECDLSGEVAFLMGNEASGLPEALVLRCTERVKIPQAGDLNSLNVAAAAAVCLYETQRQRLVAPGR